MDWSEARTRRRLGSAVGLFAVVALFSLQLAALLAHRVDYPLIDDWRYYRPDFAMPPAVSLEWLFAPAKDTLHVTGKLLDWLVFRLGSHDYRVLAAASFAFGFGGWLAASLGVCFAATRDAPWLRAASLVAFALPLSACPYWVTVAPFQKLEPAIAYHQMLPVLGLAVLVWMALSPPGKAPARLAGAGAVTLFFALTYSSGAVALFLFGALLVVLAWLRRRQEGATLLPFAGVVCAAAALCLALHIAVPTATFGRNPVLEARAYETALPFQRNFWQFFFGLFDRALLSTAIGWLPTLRGALAALALALPFGGLAWLLLTGRLRETPARIAPALVGLGAAILGYAALVAYGRAEFGQYYLAPLDNPETRASLYAHSRFFYWWITAVLPVAVVAWGLFLEAILPRRIARAAVFVLLALALLPKQMLGEEAHYLDNWRYDAAYRRDAERAAELIRQDRLKEGRRRAFLAAERRGATFVRRWGVLDRGPQPAGR